MLYTQAGDSTKERVCFRRWLGGSTAFFGTVGEQVLWTYCSKVMVCPAGGGGAERCAMPFDRKFVRLSVG
jgi:hypothetical protein